MMDSDMKVLIVDDDMAIRVSLERALRLQDFEVETASNGALAIEKVLSSSFDVVLLDYQMPDPNGLSVCRQLRSEGNETPIFMVTARDALSDRVACLDGGADDYLVKPFALEELLAKLRVLDRRTRSISKQVLSFSDLSLDTSTMRATRDQRLIELTKTEFSLLHFFMRYPNKTLTRAEIFDEIWGYDFGDHSNAHEVYVGYLRKKLEVDGEPRLIHTVRGVGYILRKP